MIIEKYKVNNNDRTLKICKTYYEVLSNYIRVRDPDKEALAELVIQAKGSKRSMRQFAAELGVNPSTLSRIINMQTVSANKDTLIADIAEHADPESGVTLEMLLEAHGMVEQGKDRVIESYSRFEKRCRMIIQDELLKRGYSVSSLQVARSKDSFDIMLKTDAVDHGEGIWAFEFKMLSPDPRISGIPTGAGRTYQCMNMIMSKFYTGTANADKVSIVVEHRNIFEQLKQKYSQYCIPDEISFVLISGNCIADEYVIPMKGRETKDTFYKIEEKMIVPECDYYIGRITNEEEE